MRGLSCKRLCLEAKSRTWTRKRRARRLLRTVLNARGTSGSGKSRPNNALIGGSRRFGDRLDNFTVALGRFTAESLFQPESHTPVHAPDDGFGHDRLNTGGSQRFANLF